MAGTALLGGVAQAQKRPRIAAITTVYHDNSHADVIITKFLEGCRELDVDFRPAVEIASLHIEQIDERDLGVALAAQHKVPVFPSIEQALTLGGEELAVDGVLLIGEHGRYPYNEIGQHMYPRRRFFDAAAAVIRRSGRAIPVFNDKHLAYAWSDARAMYDTARELKLPFLAGSSIPVSWRKPDVHLKPETDLAEAVAVGYGGTEAYGFHTLEGLQCMVENRKGGETGVRSVQCLSEDAVWKAGEEGRWSWDLLRAALSVSRTPELGKASAEEIRARCKKPDVFLIEYRDGFRAAALMLYGLTADFLFAGKIRGEAKPAATWFWLQDGKPFAHFARLSAAIQEMFLTGKPPYPVERTLLTTGILDAAMHSRFARGVRRETPELDVRYRRS
ncbi:MAG: hypothetical protein FJX77_07165 [Armatimonadetes bacterium]|nr:hypothetical protein [Armatimonadota bacterium]